jgi:hypothetical protein
MSNSSLPSSSPSSSVVRSTHASSSSSSLVLSSMHSTVITALSASSCLGASSTLTLTRDALFWSRLVDAPPLLRYCPVRAFLITVSGHRFTVILLVEICCSSPARDTPVAKCRRPLLIECMYTRRRFSATRGLFRCPISSCADVQSICGQSRDHVRCLV